MDGCSLFSAFLPPKLAPFDAVLGCCGLFPILLHVWPIVGGIPVRFLTELFEEVLLYLMSVLGMDAQHGK